MGTPLVYLINIGNSECLITPNLDGRSFRDLDKLLSYEKPGAFYIKSKYVDKIEHLLLKITSGIDGYLFPTGLLHIVLEYFESEKIQYSLNDLRKKPKSFQCFRVLNRKQLPPLRSYQEKIVELCLDKERGVVESATGTGKTRALVELVAQLSLNTLIIVPSTNILVQTYDILCNAFGLKMVGKVGDSKAQWNKAVTVANYQSLEKAPKEFWDKIDVVILDEFHHASAETIQVLNKTKFPKIYHRYGFTATNFRADGTDVALHGVLSNVIFQYNASDAIKDGYLCEPVFCVYDFHHDASLSFQDRWVDSFDEDGVPIIDKRTGKIKKKKDSAWRQEYSTRIVQNDSYHNSVAKVANQVLSQGMAVMVFVNEIEHGERLCKLIPDSVFVNGNEPSKSNKQTIKDFNDGKINCIIGTGVVGEGVDLVRASCGIMAGGGQSEVEVTQRIGRMLRIHPDKKFALIIDFRHIDSKYPMNHSKERLDVYKKFNTKIIYKDSI